MTGCGTSPLVSAFAGGVGGSLAAVATCPLEVVKTRLQSSVLTQQHSNTFGTLATFRHIIKTEGVRALYKGVGANITGVAGSRALYFFFYEVTKDVITSLEIDSESSYVVSFASATAGLATQTITAPIWFVKTRLQLSSQQRYTTWQCIRNTVQTEGVEGFFRGLTASYIGVTETVIKFLVYEKLKRYLREHHDIYDHQHHDQIEANYSIDFVFAGGISKIVATCMAYPHEVARTRLRQEVNNASERKYRSFFQTLGVVYREEGIRFGLYGGIIAQLCRVVPNSAIMFATYELTKRYICGDDVT